MILLLSKLKLSHLLSIAGVLLASYSFYAFNKIVKLEAENVRTRDNYNNALKIDSLKVAIFKINSTKELEDILEQNKNLKSLVDKSEISTKRIQGLLYQQQKYLDDIDKKMDVSNLVGKIRNNTPAITQWKDSTNCSLIKGNVTFQNDSLSVNVTSKQFNNNVVLIKHKGKRKRVKWLFGLRLGKRNIDFTPEADCGDTKVTIIDKD